MSNKVTFGLSNIHVSFVDDTTGTYEAPIKIPGAVSFTPSTRGENLKFAADNNETYYERNTNDGYTADLAVGTIPDSVLAEMLGWKLDVNGALVEDADGKPKKFALGFQVDGDARNRKSWYYDVLANRPAKAENQGKDVTPESINLSISPKLVGGVKTPKITMEESEANAAVYGTFFTTVYEPDFVTGP